MIFLGSNPPGRSGRHRFEYDALTNARVRLFIQLLYEPKDISFVFSLGTNIPNEAHTTAGALVPGAHATKALTRGLVIFGAGPSRARCLSAYV